MFNGRHARTSVKALIATLVASIISLLPAVPANAAIPATESDEVGMVDGLVRAIVVSGNRVWVGGSFSEMRDANGTKVRGASSLAVFDADTGAPITSIAVPEVTKSGTAGTVFDLSLGPDGLLYLAGSFDRVGGLARKNVAAIDPSDGSVAPFAPSTAAAKSVLATSGAVFVGTSKLLSFETNGAPSPGYDAPEVETDPSLRGHNTPPQVRDMVSIGSTIVAACQCDSTLEGGTPKASKAAIKVDAGTGAVLDWTPGNLPDRSAAFGISVLVQNDPGSGKPTVYLGSGGSDFAAGFDLTTGDQTFKTDTSGSSQALAWMDGLLYVGGHFQWVAKQQAQQCDANDSPNTDCHHAPRLVVIDPDTGRVIPEADPWNPGICCKYNGVWALTPDVGRHRLHVGGEFTKVGGTWSGGGTEWGLVGARTQSYYARFSATTTTLETLTLSFSGDGGGRVTSEPPGVDCIDDCEAGFVDGTAVTLTADPDPGSVFAGWSGSCAGTGTCQLTMDQARSVTATFALEGPTPTCGRIAYASSSGANADVFTMTRKGAQKTRLTRNAAADRDPAWSPDCSRIAYSSTRTGDAEIFVMDADGSNRTRLTDADGADTRPTWSPNGDRIAFTSTRTGDAEIFVMDADGSGLTNLTDDAARDRAPAWSPDGARIAFDSDRGGDTNVWTMNTSGGSLRMLTGDEGRSSAPAYSPDGGTIVFVSDRGGSKQIWLMDADGGRQRRLTNDGGAHTHPTFAPNGDRIAFASTRAGRNQIWVVKPNGSGAKNLSKSDRIDSTPNWS
ncbi:MAG: InlB B-repeat-containing protein [Actinomycetota bacterium]